MSEDKRTIEQIRQSYYSHGWNDYVESSTRQFSLPKLYNASYDYAYTDGWNAAKAQEEQQGIVLFLLDELLKRMDAGDEWYDTDFDKPMLIVKKIQEAYQAEKK